MNVEKNTDRAAHLANLTAAIVALFPGKNGREFMEAAIDAALNTFHATHEPTARDEAWETFVAIRDARDAARDAWMVEPVAAAARNA